MKKNHLPVFGPGPFYVISIISVTCLSIFVNHKELIPILIIKKLNIYLTILGLLLILEGIILYYYAVIKQRIDRSIKNNELVTTGVYAYVRNPVYVAFTFVLTGIILQLHNIYLLIIPLLFWIYLSLLMKFTEERWLKKVYGERYLLYCKKVNRIIPWVPKSK